MEFFEILCGIAAILLIVYYYFTLNFNFWKSRGICGPKPIPGFGNFADVLFMRKSLPDFLMELYNNYKDESMIGIFITRRPVLIVKDPDLIKDILIKDFTTFADRGFPRHEKLDPLSQHLFALEPKRWRPLRTRLSPVFTSGKLKEMFSLISQCSDRLEQYIETLATKNEPVECRELTAKYTTDVIGTCAFGIEMNALSDEDSEFRIMGRMVFMPTWENILRARLKQFLPWLCDILSYIIPHTKVNKFFIRIVTETMAYRDENNIVRHDFIDTLRELKKHPDKVNNIDLTESFIAAQAFIFFVAGFETSSTTMSNALYELALNQEIQNKLREEINEEHIRCNGNFTYENIKKINYLDKVFKETLRKYPPVSQLTRKTSSNYTFDGTKVNIPKDQEIWIPIYSIQRDPDIYPEPDVFDAERFNDEVVQTRHSMFYLPFGDGPRNCIGARFAVHQTKIGLIKILRNYKVETCEKTSIPYVNDSRTFILTPLGGIYLKMIKIDRS
ncbi:cytochrome P450 6a2-like [Cataglyphis hispanica]|uniref:cytochrome P450 6a2-like n=1 Tax=Cataglyphis hispanica TaxID=1086592 RepID=UPI0021805F53|nr:cytochrome P450 6a2-like [Cataglyphis hispanica]XP_050445490.1 cytochrome P450 6a2-like [Cataglyphis hispanica]